MKPIMFGSSTTDRTRTRIVFGWWCCILVPVRVLVVQLQLHKHVAESFTPIKSYATRRQQLNNVHAYQHQHRQQQHQQQQPLSRVVLLVKSSQQEDRTTTTTRNEDSNENKNENDTKAEDDNDNVNIMFFAKPFENSSINGEVQNQNHTSEERMTSTSASGQVGIVSSGTTENNNRQNGQQINKDNTNTKTLPYATEIAEYISRPKSELIDAGLVLLSSFAVALGTLPDTMLPDIIATISIYGEEVLSYFFCFGFLLRWYAVGNLSMSYFKSPLSFLDFFASVLPLLLLKGGPLFGATIPAWVASDNSALVNLRLFRILRLQKLLVDNETFSKVEETLGVKPGNIRPYQLQLARVLISIFTLCSVATGLIYTAEHEVNPLIPDYFTALYFGLTTLTTVGFGDITPITLPGRLVVMGSILVGVAVIPAQAAELVEALLDFQAERRQKSLIKNTLRSRMDRDIDMDVDMDMNINSGFENDDMIDPRISCSSCGRRSHRGDAFYCWSCGAKLWQ